MVKREETGGNRREWVEGLRRPQGKPAVKEGGSTAGSRRKCRARVGEKDAECVE